MITARENRDSRMSTKLLGLLGGAVGDCSGQPQELGAGMGPLAGSDEMVPPNLVSPVNKMPRAVTAFFKVLRNFLAGIIFARN